MLHNQVLRRKRRTHSAPLFGPDGVQLAGQPATVCATLHDESPGSTPSTVVREAEERERLGPPGATLPTELGSQLAELDEACLVLVHGVAEDDGDLLERHEVEAAWRQNVVARRGAPSLCLPRVRWSVEAPPVRPVLHLAEQLTDDQLLAVAASGLSELANRRDFGEHQT